jgi:UDP-2-acetamido-3-amino-2,3-dideoxy-glucuronate N-acetyltransferase
MSVTSDHPNVKIHETSVVDADASVGPGTSIWHFSHVMAGAQVGENCVIGQNVMIADGASVGNGVKIQNNVSVYRGVILEDAVFCGPSMVFTNVLTPRAFVDRKSEFASTRVGYGATIGANATIVCGNTIGNYAMIGAGAVVTKNVRNHALVLGNPASESGWVSRTGERMGSDLICPRTGEQYRLGDDGLEMGVNPKLR